MLEHKNLKIKKNGNVWIYFQFIIVAFAVLFSAFLLLMYPENSSKGISEAIELCYSVIVPSLYPFMVLSSFFVESSLCQRISGFFEKITRFIFDLPGITTSVIILSLVGGFPVGASMTANLYKKRQITKETGQRLLLFCIGPGPAFVINAVGTVMLGCKEIGIIMYISLVVSSLLIGFLTRFIAEKNEVFCFASNFGKLKLSDALVNSVSKSTTTMLTVCGWILLFSSVVELTKSFNLSDDMNLAITCFLEVTSACKKSCGMLSVPVIAGIIGWGGLSTHCQLMPFVKALNLKLKLFWTFRAVNGALAAVICQILLTLFPIEENVMLKSNAKLSVSQNSSVLISLSMFAMCLLFLLGNNYIVYNKKKNGS